MRLSNYILYGTTAIIVCLTIGYSIYIAFPGSAGGDSQLAELKSSLKKISEENENLRSEFERAVSEKENVETALRKATDLSKTRNGEISKLEEQLATLTAANKSPADALNQQVITDLLGLLKCPVTELANQTKFALDQNVNLQKLLTSANKKLSESQTSIDTLSSQVTKLKLANATLSQSSKGNTPLIPPLRINGREIEANRDADKTDGTAAKLAANDGSQGPIANQKKNTTADAKPDLQETATRQTPSENEIALSKERERLMTVVSELQSELKNRENLLLAQTSLIEDLKKKSSRTETTFRQNLGGTISPAPAKPFREIGTFKSVFK